MPPGAGATDYFLYSFRFDTPSETEATRMRSSVVGFRAMICAILSWLPPAYADDCKDQTQSGLNACADAAYNKADAALNFAYKQILQRLKDDSATAKLLVTAQQAWIAYRDAECAFASSANAGGSNYPMVVSICLEDVTQERTKDLEAFLKCSEGDTGCPVPGK
jgi:uncharacterized protein YecT (DUF1311 family)